VVALSYFDTNTQVEIHNYNTPIGANTCATGGPSAISAIPQLNQLVPAYETKSNGPYGFVNPAAIPAFNFNDKYPSYLTKMFCNGSV